MTADEIFDLGRRAEAMIRQLAAITSEPGRITRLFLSPEHRQAADLVADWMRAAGLEVSEDALGTVRGRLRSSAESAGANDGRRLLIGSHIDSVIDAGAYDGTFGVIAGILAAEAVARRTGVRPFGIDILAFGDEEGSRFPSTLSSSSAVAGAFQAETLDLRDTGGISFREALRQYGKDPADIPLSAYDPHEVAGYLEVHIEQGPALEAAGEPLGIVTAIAGQTRMTVTLTGVAGHAGTVPMGLRRDALAAAAAVVLAVEKAGRSASGRGVVATVGKLDIRPGASNVIPATANLTIDLRAPVDEDRHRVYVDLRRELEDLAAERGVALAIRVDHEVAAAPCSRDLQGLLAQATADIGLAAPALASGAGHDGQAMQSLCPIGMLFVRCKGGISHNPAEFASEADMGLAIATLIAAIERFQA